METTIKVAIGLAVVILALAAQAWIIMMLAMVINNYWVTFPAFSFLESVVISLAIGFVVGLVRK